MWQCGMKTITAGRNAESAVVIVLGLVVAVGLVLLIAERDHEKWLSEAPLGVNSHWNKKPARHVL
jgi:hypothetical protein